MLPEVSTPYVRAWRRMWPAVLLTALSLLGTGLAAAMGALRGAAELLVSFSDPQEAAVALVLWVCLSGGLGLLVVGVCGMALSLRSHGWVLAAWPSVGLWVPVSSVIAAAGSRALLPGALAFCVALAATISWFAIGHDQVVDDALLEIEDRA